MFSRIIALVCCRRYVRGSVFERRLHKMVVDAMRAAARHIAQPSGGQASVLIAHLRLLRSLRSLRRRSRALAQGKGAKADGLQHAHGALRLLIVSLGG